MRLIKHFVLLVYPFRHSLLSRNRSQWERINHGWLPWWSRLGQTEGALAQVLDDTYFFLPYVRRLLFPETDLLAQEDESLLGRLTKAQQLAVQPVTELAPRLPQGSVLRLTCVPERVQALHPLRLTFERKDAAGNVLEQFEAPFRIEWVDIFLFPQEVGFLTLKITLEEEEPLRRQLTNFLYYLRLIHPPAAGWTMAKLQRAGAERPLSFATRDLVDFLLQGFTEVGDGDADTMEAFLRRCQECSFRRYTATEDGQVHGERFSHFVYACLDEVNDPPVAQNAPSVGMKQLFGSRSEQALYELATLTDLNNSDYIPAKEEWDRLFHEHQITLWDNWRGMVLRDSAIFLGLRPSNFTLCALAHHCEYDYFHLYLLTLYQRMRLSFLAGELMRFSGDLHTNVKEARRLWDKFITFRNMYWLYEVNRKPQGTFLYHAYQRGLEVLPLYHSVSTEVESLQEYYERKVERNINRLLSFLTFVGLPAGLLAQFFANALIKDANWSQFFITALILYGLIGVGWWVWWRYRYS